MTRNGNSKISKFVKQSIRALRRLNDGAYPHIFVPVRDLQTYFTHRIFWQLDVRSMFFTQADAQPMVFAVPRAWFEHNYIIRLTVRPVSDLIIGYGADTVSLFTRARLVDSDSSKDMSLDAA